ncbi:MAG: response regulator, partial [Oscillospiraceae bacterium]|nr:response regulator [Oscillospiraceae bacterium]
MDKTPKHSVLIVDDEKLVIDALVHILNSEYFVYVSKNGKDAIKMAEKHLPDVILLDIIMPEMDGYDVITELKKLEITRNIPIIFISGLTEATDEKKGLALGAADYITKPFNPEVVKQRIQKQISVVDLYTAQYELTSYKLASEALKIALWNMEIVIDDPVNPDNKFIWSHEFRQMLGFSDENDFPNVLSSWSNRLHPEDMERSVNAFAKHINDYTGKTPYYIEYRLRHKSGEYRYFDGFGTTLRDSEGVPIRVSGAIRDITDKKQAEISLKYRELALGALNKTASIFLSRNEDTFEETMSSGIWQISDLFDIDRFSLFRNYTKPDGLYASQIYRWEKKSGG